MRQLSKKQIKQLMARARLMRARVHLGYYGVRPNTLAAFVQAFHGTCIKPTPTDLVRVKVHPTYTGSIEEAVAAFCAGNGAQFIQQEGNHLVFWLAPS